MDKAIIFAIIGIVVLGILFWAAQSGFFAGIFQQNITPAVLPEGIVLFYGDGCPHCKNVEDFIIQNKIEEKVKITRVEIPFNGKTSPELESNALAALQKAQSCGIDISQGLAVPFMLDGKGKCIEGDVDSINFLKNEAGIK